MTGADSCPACGSGGLEPFHAQDDVPVHSCRLLETRREALAFPRGALRLAVCPSCGFVTNTAFDPERQDYGQRYEETQGFSPHFRAFAESLAQRLIDRYDVREKDVLEIGCGKGEFLALLCKLGDNRGVGVDPSFVPERLDDAVAGRATFIRDYYSPRYADLTGDLVVCRHTLEHIQPVAELVGMVRRSLDEADAAVVFFEIPDAMRVLREAAFWDVYYEHCSYFSCGSLARLFRRTGFDVLDVGLAFDDQYVLLDARPAAAPVHAPLSAEEPVEETVAAARAFPARFAEAHDRWRDLLDAAAGQGRVALWGSGSKAVSFLTTLRVGEEVGCVVDVNPYKHGHYLPVTGHPIVAPEELQAFRPDLVVAMNGAYRDEIGAALRRLDVPCELVTLDDAAGGPAAPAAAVSANRVR